MEDLQPKQIQHENIDSKVEKTSDEGKESASQEKEKEKHNAATYPLIKPYRPPVPFPQRLKLM